MLDIINESKKREIRVPPGVYAELGYIYLNENNISKSKQYIELEIKTYPESKYFMNQILLKIDENN